MSTRILARLFCLITAGSFLAAGCAPSQSVDEDPALDDGKGDGVWRPIDADESPSLLVNRASKRLSTNISLDDVGQTYGTPDDAVPYPDTYWPYNDPTNQGESNEPIVNSIDDRWSGHDQSPLERYMALTSPGDTEAAKAWQLANHGKNAPNVAPWFGLCNGWTGSALSEKPVRNGVDVKLVSGTPVVCDPGSEGCVHFDLGDINGLLAEAYLSADSDFLGARCDLKPSEVQRDQYGRITSPGCQGANAGSLMIVAHVFMKNRKIGFAVNAQEPDATNEIWNQPAYRYSIDSYDALTEEEAARLVSGGRATSYGEFNADAKGWVRVHATFSWVTENGPNEEYVDGTESTMRTVFDMVIELDKEVSDVAHPGTANIIGGEYLDANGGNRLNNFPYLWVPKGIGPDSGGDNNPYLKPSLIRQIADLARSS